MKKILIFLTFVILLTGCKDTPDDTVDPLNCTDDQIEVDGVCEDIVVDDVDYEANLITMYQSFMEDFNEIGIGSYKLDVITTPRLLPLDGPSNDRVIITTKFDLNEEYYVTTADLSTTTQIDYIESFGKIDTGYELYYINNDEEHYEIIVPDSTFLDTFTGHAKIDFDLEQTDGILAVSSTEQSIYKLTVTKEYLSTHIDETLLHYFDDFTNTSINMTIEFNQLDSEYVVSFDMNNDNADGDLKDISVVLTVKILDQVERYLIPEID